MIGVAALCYLGAAALDRRWVAWAGCVVVSLVLVASQAIGLVWWAVGATLALVVAGLLLGVPRPPLTAQTAALIGYGAMVAGAERKTRLRHGRLGLLLNRRAAGSRPPDMKHQIRNLVPSGALADGAILEPQRQARRQPGYSTLPGFMTPVGSSARLIARITSVASPSSLTR